MQKKEKNKWYEYLNPIFLIAFIMIGTLLIIYKIISGLFVHAGKMLEDVGLVNFFDSF